MDTTNTAPQQDIASFPQNNVSSTSPLSKVNKLSSALLTDAARGFSSMLSFGRKKGQLDMPGIKQNPADDAISKFSEGLVRVVDLIAPAAMEVDFNHIKIGNIYYRTFFVTSYPRFVGPNWLSSLITFEDSLDISMFYYPVDSRQVLQKLRNKIAQMEATLSTDAQAGKVVDPGVKVALDDAKSMQEALARGSERYFNFGLYITIQATTIAELDNITKRLETTMGASLLNVRPATLQMEQGFQSTKPEGWDKLFVLQNMDTTSIATTFPFVSSELTSEKGILYGINKSNKSLVVFDRFEMENANSVIFAKSGAGKSYLVKLEAMRSLMLGTKIIIIDPESEYRDLCQTLNGAYISFSQDGESKINPFDLIGMTTIEGDDELKSKLLFLKGFFKLIFGGGIIETGANGLSNLESAILDQALILTYYKKGITFDPATQTKEPPTMIDLYNVLMSMKQAEAQNLALRLETYIKGSASGIFDQQSTITLDNDFTVFSLRDMSEVLRPIAMYLMMDFIWTKVRQRKQRRLLMVDEAWIMMRDPDAAQFMNMIAKRARKYYLGLTTITQDVEDFLGSAYGPEILHNSSIQILLKQGPSSIDLIGKTFYLSDGEKNLLLSADVGEGLFFAGANHVALQVISSEYEHGLITSNPVELEKLGRLNPEKQAPSRT